MPRTLPNVYEFRDYRLFLRAYYESARVEGKPISLRAFGKRAGFRSPNYLKLVMDGERNLTSSMARRFAEAIGLRANAGNYFCELVTFNQERDSVARARIYERLSKYSAYRKVHKLAAAQDAYYAHWYLPAIRELAARQDFQEDSTWIARTLLPPISARDAQHALNVLTELGLLVRDDTGRLVQAHGLVKTQDGPLGHQLVAYHRNMLERASEALDRIPRAERDIASLTLCVDEAQMAEIKSRLEQFRGELLQEFTAGPAAKRVLQVNFQMFPLSNKET